MKTKLTALALVAMTVAAVGLYPTTQGAVTPPVKPPAIIPPVTLVGNEKPRIEVVFVLDTTGSMGGLIQGAKDKIWSIASQMAQADPTPEIRMGLVGFRDRGDAYVTRKVDLSADLDSMYAQLMDFAAAGGGDGPESVNQALYDAVHGMQWSDDPQTYKVIFLVGDAPPHMDYAGEVQYPQTLIAAGQKGIVVNTIQCGQHVQTVKVWQQVAQLGMGRYFQVEQSGGAIAMATPYDAKLAELSAALDSTRLYYGGEEAQDRARRKQDAAAKLNAEAPESTLAARAAFNVSSSGERNLLGDDELVDAVASGRVDLEELDADLLPETVKAMSPEEQVIHVAEKAEQRAELKRQITDLSQQRAGYLSEKSAELGASKDAFDDKIESAVREQAAKAGLKYADEDSD